MVLHNSVQFENVLSELLDWLVCGVTSQENQPLFPLKVTLMADTIVAEL